jgi:hypothetical protein
MSSSRIWDRVGVVKVDISEELVASVFRVERIGDRGAALAVGRNVGSHKTHTAPHPRRRPHVTICLK